MDKKYSEKVELDKFYTKESIAKKCIDSIDIDSYDLIIEPSAGGGSFFNNIDSLNKIGLDLLPESKDIIKQDWFDYKIDNKYKNVLVIGNPPFGKRNKLSGQFIKHSCTFDNVKTIAFVLPNVYNKHTLQKNFSSKFRLKQVIDLGVNAFEINGEDYHVPCSFFIFDKSEGDCLRFKPEEWKESKDWAFGTEVDFSFYVMGAAPKRLKMKPHKNNRGYFIKVKPGVSISSVRYKFRNNLWKGNSSANGGVAWLTKPELVHRYENWTQDPNGGPKRKTKK
jgi:hypothetical protein